MTTLTSSAAAHALIAEVSEEADALASSRIIINPATRDPLAVVRDRSASDVDSLVRAAKDAAPTWSGRTPRERADVLFALAARIDDRAELLGAIESLNTGKPLAMALDEVALAADAVRFFAGAARTATAPAPGEYVAGRLSLLLREPIGVTAGITPWNYPLLTAAWKFAPSLAAGNCVIIKPAELTPLSMLALLRVAEGILPAGVLSAVTGTGHEVGEALAVHDGIGLVSLTGSVSAGRAVSAAAADSLKRVHLELGGKAPVLVFDDADLDLAVETITRMAYWNAGQECGSATRIFVARPIADDFIARLVAASRSIVFHRPGIDELDGMGALISDTHRDRVHGFVERAVRDGAAVACGGAVPEGSGYFYPPTVVLDVPGGSEIDQSEVFGPVVTVRIFENETELLRTANETIYGLSASVWTRDVDRALRAAQELDFGTVWVNDHLAIATEMPWSGFKQSGTGHDLSTLSLDEYVRVKHVMVSTSSSATISHSEPRG